MYSQKAKPKAKAAPKAAAKVPPKKTAAPKAAAKKTTQTTIKVKPTAGKKRPKPDTEDEDSDLDRASLHDASLLSATPPDAKKPKKIPGPKKTGAKPLKEVENEAIHFDGSPDQKPKKGSKSKEEYQKVRKKTSRNDAAELIGFDSSLNSNTSSSVLTHILGLLSGLRSRCGSTTPNSTLWK